MATCWPSPIAPVWKSRKSATIPPCGSPCEGDRPWAEQWPTTAMKVILPNPNMKSGELVDHIALLLAASVVCGGSLAFVKIAEEQNARGASPSARARSV